MPGVRNIVYQPHRAVTPNQHHYLIDTEAGALNAQAVARVALSLKESGFVPDVILGHNGWGEIWYLKVLQLSRVYVSSPVTVRNAVGEEQKWPK